MSGWLYFLSSVVWAWPVQSPKDVKHDYPVEIDASQWLIPATVDWSARPKSDLKLLAKQCRQMLTYLKAYPQSSVGMFSELGVTPDQITAGLELVSRARPKDIENPVWWQKHFQLYWLQNPGLEEHHDRIRMTKYVVYQFDGSRTKTEEHTHALWQIDPNASFRTRYTRQDIISGVLEKEPAAKPLAWLSLTGMFESQLQGTVEVHFKEGDSAWYNVHVSNELPYKKGVSAKSQERYWYFRPVNAFYGWGEEEKVVIDPMVSFAGDIYNFGLGHLLWLESDKGHYVGVLADTGGAFQPNLGQFDWFIGIVRDRAHFYERALKLPKYSKVGFLLPRSGLSQPQ